MGDRLLIDYETLQEFSGNVSIAGEGLGGEVLDPTDCSTTLTVNGKLQSAFWRQNGVMAMLQMAARQEADNIISAGTIIIDTDTSIADGYAAV